MNQMKPLLALLLATSLLAGCATPLGDALPLSQNAIENAAKFAPPASDGDKSAAEVNITTTVPYNLGIKGHTVAVQRSSTLSNGLKETIAQGRSRMGSSEGEGVSRTISLCGLVTLIQESGSPGSMGSLVFTGKAGAFTPIGASPPTSVRQITTSIDIDSPDICKPEVGKTYGFKMAMKHETNIPPFRRVVDLVETYTCRATADLDSFNTLKQAGGRLLLTCSISREALDRPSEKRFVFFPALKEYFEVFTKYQEGYFMEYNYIKPPQPLRQL